MDAVRRFFRVFDEGAIFKWIVVCLFVLQGLLLLSVNLRTSYLLVRRLGDVTVLFGLAIVVLVLALLLATLLALVVLGLRGVVEVIALKPERYSPLRLCAKLLRVDGEAALFFLLVLAPADLAQQRRADQLLAVLASLRGRGHVLARAGRPPGRPALGRRVRLRGLSPGGDPRPAAHHRG